MVQSISKERESEAGIGTPEDLLIHHIVLRRALGREPCVSQGGPSTCLSKRGLTDKSFELDSDSLDNEAN
jgi:hypothetical protein